LSQSASLQLVFGLGFGPSLAKKGGLCFVSWLSLSFGLGVSLSFGLGFAVNLRFSLGLSKRILSELSFLSESLRFSLSLAVIAFAFDLSHTDGIRACAISAFGAVIGL